MSTLFGPSFLDDHVGQIKTDPRIAVIELIANASDAGATTVNVEWPEQTGDRLSVTDNGIGMKKDELLARWSTLCFDRRKVLGKEVTFPADVKPKPQRSLFGKTGKGRHAAFCFADEYSVETWRDGQKTTATVKQTYSSNEPFSLSVVSETPQNGHGTKVYAKSSRGFLPEAEIIEVIGSKFLIDPSFSISLNGKVVALTAINGIKQDEIKLSQGRRILIITIDSDAPERNNRLRGVAWWVNNRLVGAPSWKSVRGGTDYLDGRSNAAKRFAFVVKADVLDQQVKEDWSEFKQSELTEEVTQKVDTFVQKALSELLAESRRERKLEVLDENKRVIAELPPSSRVMVGEFVEQVQKSCPSMKQEDMANAVQVFAKLEQARSGYDLLRQLAACSTEDLDRWQKIIHKWDARKAQIVLDELDKRIQLVSEMRRLVNEKTTDELHELQPLFEQGLWIFGPQYETVEFVANRSLKTIIEKFLGGKAAKLTTPAKRPDILTLPIGVWDSTSYDSEGNVSGSEKVLILELKRGGFHLGQSELDQARDYALQLRRASGIQPQTKVDCIVMGSSLEAFVSELNIEDQLLRVTPKTYDTVLKQADLRLFNLRKRIEALGTVTPKDKEVEIVLARGIQEEMAINSPFVVE